MIMLLFSAMCFMLVWFLVCHPRSKLKYLFALLTGTAAILLAAGRFVDPAWLKPAWGIACFNTAATAGAFILLKRKKQRGPDRT